MEPAKPKVFISWSGPRSKHYATAVHGWLPDIIQDSAPWMSRKIEAGQAWDVEIRNALEAVQCGIICCTRRSITSPWLLFEAGAIAKAFQDERTRVIPLLFDDLQPSHLEGTPLKSFQAVRADQSGTLELLKSIAKATKSNVDPASLDRLLSRHWAALESDFQKAPDECEPNAPEVSHMQHLRDTADETLRWVGHLAEKLDWMHEVNRLKMSTNSFGYRRLPPRPIAPGQWVYTIESDEPSFISWGPDPDKLPPDPIPDPDPDR